MYRNRELIVGIEKDTKELATKKQLRDRNETWHEGTCREGSGCPRQTSRREDYHIVRNADVQITASSAAIQVRGAPLLGAPMSSRTIRRCLADGHLGSRRSLRVLPLTPTHRCLRLEGYRASDDNRVRVWKPRGECLNSAFALQRHSTPTAGVMVWGVIAYNTQSPLVLIPGTMTTQRYVHDILQQHVLPLMQRLPGAIFQQDNARHHTARVSQKLSPHCYYPSLACPISRFVSNRAYLGSLRMASWLSHEFERTRGKVTENME
ncbi:transposable element Tcb1 transposase [Trichonephila clavipes]|nr:transposable element Tcb1 transposase [Trichonephila clavipes]